MLAFTGLAARADTLAHSLTPAEKRRLEVARALATEPRLLLLDEMLTGLTPVEAQSGVQLIRDVRAPRHHGDDGGARDGGAAAAGGSRGGAGSRPRADDRRAAEVVRNPDVIRAYLGDRYAAA